MGKTFSLKGVPNKPRKVTHLPGCQDGAPTPTLAKRTPLGIGGGDREAGMKHEFSPDPCTSGLVPAAQRQSWAQTEAVCVHVYLCSCAFVWGYLCVYMQCGHVYA